VGPHYSTGTLTRRAAIKGRIDLIKRPRSPQNRFDHYLHPES